MKDAERNLSAAYQRMAIIRAELEKEGRNYERLFADKMGQTYALLGEGILKAAAANEGRLDLFSKLAQEANRQLNEVIAAGAEFSMRRRNVERTLDRMELAMDGPQDAIGTASRPALPNNQRRLPR